MAVVDLGASVKAVWAGAPAGGTYAVALTRPDGTSFTPPAISLDLPVSVTFVPDQAGLWLIRWTSTVVPGAYTDVVDVWPTNPRMIISLDDARAALSLPGNTSQSTLEELRLHVCAATPVIEDIVGPVLVRTLTQTVQKGWNYAALYEKAGALVSVVNADSTVVPESTYTFNAASGLLTFDTPTSQVVTVTYTSGAAVIPQNVRLAALELVRHLWQVRQRPQGPTPPEAYTPSGFAVPKRVIELCKPSAKLGGFA